MFLNIFYSQCFATQPSVYVENPFVTQNPVDVQMSKIIEKAKSRIAIENGDSTYTAGFLNYLREMITSYGVDGNNQHAANVLNNLIRSFNASYAEISSMRSSITLFSPKLNSTVMANELMRLLDLVKTEKAGIVSHSQCISIF